MPAELIVVNGPSAGTRYAMEGREVLIGRAPNSHIVLPEPDVGWRHCEIRMQGDRFLIRDLKSSGGTHVNGIRSAERWLENQDQIGIGKTILMFRTGAFSKTSSVNGTGGEPEKKPVLLAACSLVFLFRALAASVQEEQIKILRQQILHLVCDLLPLEQALLLLGTEPRQLAVQLEAQAGAQAAVYRTFLERVCEEGATVDHSANLIGVPLYTGSRLSGALLVSVIAAEGPNLQAHHQDLTAVASLASAGFEANQEVQTLQAEKELLQEQIGNNSGIVGSSPGIKRVLERLERIAPLDLTVMITGESGTGKELIARALHEKSDRKSHPFIPVNCAALSENLFESELFGHEKGAFTGAISLKRGRFELADGGTIFLDEVGEVPLPLQSKLLRVLEDRKFERVGGTALLPLDIRIVSATNRDLKEEVREKRFREDLYHRLNVVELRSPPLRERQEDIPKLAEYFLERACRTCKRQVHGLSPPAMDLLFDYAWPGNIRELRNAIERAVAIGVSDWILPEDLPESLLESAPEMPGARYHSSVSSAKRDTILDAYRQGNGDYKQAAAILGLHPNYLLRLVRNMNLKDEIKRQGSANKSSGAVAGQ